MTPRFLAAACSALGLLTGCKDEHKPAAQAASGPDKVVLAVELDIRASAGMPGTPRFRGVHVFSQAIAQRQAVCGQLAPFGDDSNVFVPFVSVVTAAGDPARYTFEHRIGATTAEASRVYAAIVTYCYEDGGPAAGPFPSVNPTPPLPDDVPNPATPAASPKPAQAASGNVTVRQAATLHADPHGASVRTVQRGTALKVFSQAPGGWLQVGATSPEGWMHESMLERH